MNLHNVEFIKSAANVDAVPRDGLPQIVFSGKSNVGKSSVINKLLNRKQFARVSATPGKTAHINYFLIDKQVYFVDLPGYGYAKVSKSERARWAVLMESFFRNPAYITRGVMIVDSRHKPTNDDITMADWFKATGCPLTIVANKIDKLKKSEIAPNMARIRETLELPDDVTIVEFSAEKGTNKETLIAEIKCG
ncbi:MAG: ribosome biogenesis GTP-binding protein YihA/YsxC [Oscillospiraceae bacterium]|nr:ribosome biogenesis GTP-binding protein YihA/YsxC [Oscillospiraceae bacterium]